MYRQILVSNHYTPYQRIVWREDPSRPLEEYELLTVTYGTASAPYLAMKTLTQLAADEFKNYPMAAKALKANFYVDDVLAGSNDIERAIELQRQLIAILSGAGMNLRKWVTNDDRLNRDIPVDEAMMESIECIKTLGINWDARNDKFQFNINLTEEPYKITKRNVLSCGKLFDPLGLIGPVIVTGKLIMQQLWLLKLQWDEELTGPLMEKWQLFYNQLLNINNVKIPRCVMQINLVKIEIHGFADASIVAYGACLCVKTTNLVCSKSRVAPLEVQSIPRLELNAALLLARLVKEVATVLDISNDSVILWSDSTTVLQWLMMAWHLTI